MPARLNEEYTKHRINVIRSGGLDVLIFPFNASKASKAIFYYLCTLIYTGHGIDTTEKSITLNPEGAG